MVVHTLAFHTYSTFVKVLPCTNELSYLGVFVGAAYGCLHCLGIFRHIRLLAGLIFSHRGFGCGSGK